MEQATLELLVERGTLDTDRVSTRPTHRHCRTCGLVVLVALADDGPQTNGVRVSLDPRPLTTLGELQALMADHLTYHRTTASIAWRDPVTIARRPADTSEVFHTHTCASVPFERKPDKESAAAATDRTYSTIPF